MDTKPLGRRRFLKDGALLAGMAMGAMRAPAAQSPAGESPQSRPADARAYGERSRFETAARLGDPPLYRYVQARITPIQDSIGILTPSSLHFMNNHGYEPPDINPREHRLMIHGLVERPLIFTLEELKRLPAVSRVHFIECAGNTSPSLLRQFRHNDEEPQERSIQQTYGMTACSEWTGVLLSVLLKEAGLQKNALWILAEGAETGKHSKSIPIEKAMDDVLVAYGQNGEAVRPEQGYPLRLLVPGWEGISNVKWLRRIKIVDQPYMAKWETIAYSSLRPDGKARWFNFEMGVKSVITYPSNLHRLPAPGFYQISGLAWSGGGSIRRVEVSTDGGKTWKDAQIQQPVHRIAHTRFRMDWKWNGEETVLQSRSTDDRGQMQPTMAEISKIWGVDADYFLTTTNVVNHFNAIQPWKVNRDGSVHNAMFG